jgi:hypothetical protein
MDRKPFVDVGQKLLVIVWSPTLPLPPRCSWSKLFVIVGPLTNNQKMSEDDR